MWKLWQKLEPKTKNDEELERRWTDSISNLDYVDEYDHVFFFNVVLLSRPGTDWRSLRCTHILFGKIKFID